MRPLRKVLSSCAGSCRDPREGRKRSLAGGPHAPILPSPGVSPLPGAPSLSAPRRAETRKTPLSPRTLGYLRPPLAPAGRAVLQLRSPSSSACSGWLALPSRARPGCKVQRWQRLEPGRQAPERGDSSRPERTSEPGPPSSAPDSRRLSRSRGGAADASRRLPAFSISLFSP